MYNISYVSNADREELIRLNDALRSATTLEDQAKIREEIASIEETRKPLHECTIEECVELRTFLWDKFDKLNKAGRYTQAVQFKQMLRQIEIRQSMLYREQTMEEQKRRAETAEAQRHKVEQSRKKKKQDHDSGNGTTGSATLSSKWTTGIGDLD